MNEDLLIEILALDNLIKTYVDQSMQGITFESQEEEFAFLDIKDRAFDLLKRKVEQLPSSIREQIEPNLWYGQIKYPGSSSTT